MTAADIQEDPNRYLRENWCLDLKLENGRYLLRSYDFLEMLRGFRTPIYVYDGERIKEQFGAVSEGFKNFSHRIMYPIKALSNMSILRLMRELGAGLDAVSIQEVYIGLRAGFQPSEILFTPNCVNFQEIVEVANQGVLVTIDCLSNLEQFGAKFRATKPLCIRFNPHVVGGGHAYVRTGHIDSKFGISIFQQRHVLRVVEKFHMRVVGIHVHTGSDILNVDSYLQSVKVIVEVANSFKDLKFLDLGSGFKVPYNRGDIGSNIGEIGHCVQKEIAENLQGFGDGKMEIWFEPGKFLVSQAGYLLCKVGVVKPTPATVFVGLESGFNHLIRPMFYGSSHEILNLSNPEGVPRVYTVVGNLCETDTFCTDCVLPEVREGDIIAICNAGAYGYSMSSNYNSRPRPAEVLIVNGQAKLIRRAEVLDDLIQGQVILDFEELK